MTRIPPARDRRLPAERHRYLREQLAREFDPEKPAAAARPVWRRSVLLAPAAVVALSVAVAAGVAVTRDGNDEAPPGPSSDLSFTSASALFEQAARRAEAKAPPKVADQQFIYTKRQDYHWKLDPGIKLPAGCATTDEGHPYGLREIAASVDGKHVGSSREHRDGRTVERQIAKQLPGKGMPTSYRQVQRDVPTDARTMSWWLSGSGKLPPPQMRAGLPNEMTGSRTAARLLNDHLLPPKTEAAVYRALARMTKGGHQKTELLSTKDVAGRNGIGVRFQQLGGVRLDLVFDRQDLTYMGTNTVDVSGPKDKCDVLHIGDVVSGTAVLKRAVVDALADGS
ncbi:hypothetical protein G5C51_00390 [Streptomyces sp. A7024]|uniref:CU044_5270 family protein n=1 Tax=Streptomyces coryli TaxID=1128680 RepID=A0A6G4TTQ1_9ACTN|nr:hypothetical protein [Streptomyces coryli]